jgi:hypothetical protein
VWNLAAEQRGRQGGGPRGRRSLVCHGHARALGGDLAELEGPLQSHPLESRERILRVRAHRAAEAH